MKAAKQHPLHTGKRKTSICRAQIFPGDGKFLVNERTLENYFGREVFRFIVRQPLEVTGTNGQFDVTATLHGGGLSGQASALKHAIAKGLLQLNPDYRKPLKAAGLLTRDSRIVERKKYGRHKARRGNQWTKR
ncbi:MAG: 30S ribosomal protein S9 [bacterium]|nr:30S ribosomal protein S9 [bacterium]